MESDARNYDVTLEVDTRGKPRPMPTMGAVKGIDYIDIGEVVEVLFDDPACIQDIKNWALLKGHEVVDSGPHGNVYSVCVKRMK